MSRAAAFRTAGWWRVRKHSADNEPLRREQQQRTRGGLIGTEDTLAFEVRESVDDRIESDLSLAINESPAPVLLATLLRNSGDRPAGVIITDRPECEAALPHLGPDGSSSREELWITTTELHAHATALPTDVQHGFPE